MSRTNPLNENIYIETPDFAVFTSTEKLQHLLHFSTSVFRFSPWKLYFKASVHGFSAVTLTENCSSSKPYLTVIKTKTGNIIGCFQSTGWRLFELKEFYGNGEGFVFTYSDGKIPKVWKWKKSSFLPIVS